MKKFGKLKLVVTALMVVLAACVFFACGNGGETGGGAETPQKPGTEQTGETDTPGGSEESGLKKFSGISFSNKTVTYNGKSQTIEIDGEVPDGAEIVYDNNARTDAGEQTVTVTISCDGYETKILTAKLIIKKAKFDSFNLDFSDKTVDYNGAEQAIMLDGADKLPEGTKVEYSKNSATDAGEYSATVKLTRDNYETKTLTAKLKINKIQFPNIRNLLFKGKIFLGNGAMKRVALNKSEEDFPQGTEIIYSNNEKTNGGKYHASVKITNKNYIEINLGCDWRIISIKEITDEIKKVMALNPSPLDYLPSAFGLSDRNTASGSLTIAPAYDFANSFVNVSSINEFFIGKQLNAVYDMVVSSEKVLSVCDAVTGAATVVGESIANQLLTKDELDELDLAFDINAAGFTKARFVMQGEKVGILVGNKNINAELYYDFEKEQRFGRYQILAGDIAGAVLQFYVGDNGLTLTYAADVAKQAAAVKEIVISKSNNVTAGYLYEYTGTVTGDKDDTTDISADDPTKEGYGVRSVAAIRSDANTTVIMSNKRETDDMPMYGYEEVYDSKTGKFIGAEVSEYLKVSGKDEDGTVNIDKKYDTFWFNIYDVSNFVYTIKAENKANGMNLNTIYINGSANAIHSKWVTNFTVSTSPDTSRRFDIEMKDVYYVVKSETDGKVAYSREKASLPMLFVQNTGCKDRVGFKTVESTCVAEFGKNWIDKNYNKDETKSSGAKETEPKLPSTSKLTANFETMKNLFATVCSEVNYASIKATIGQPNAFFTE